MKRLTGVTVILAGIGAVAGIFGMSEANGPGGQLLVDRRADRRRARPRTVVLRRIDWILSRGTAPVV